MACYIVLGVPRGGTSMISGLLRIFDINMGDNIDETKHEDLEPDKMVFEELAEYIFEKNKRFTKEGKDWGWKSPWIGNFLKDVHNFFAEPKYIWITRDLVACMNSDLKHNKTWEEKRIPESHIWIRNLNLINEMEKIMRLTNVPLLRLSYEESLKNPEDLIDKLEEFIGRKLSPEKREQAIKFIKPGYRKIK